MIDYSDVPRLNEDMRLVNAHIERICQSDMPTMQVLMDWMLQARGKQIRPLLTLLCSRLKGRYVDATETAAVIEICHTASLIHDDIIDEADIRRGVLSLQKKFGKEMAVYAGDFMIFCAIARTQLVNKPWYRTMFEKLGVMCNGEVGQYDNQYNTSIREQTYIDNIIGKTSAMFAIACVAGAYEGKFNKAERNAVNQFAESFGLMFQMRDDLMDFVSETEISQKTVHNDFGCGYYTLPAIHTFGDPECGEALRSIANKLKGQPDNHDYDQLIADLIAQADGYQYTINKIRVYGKKAMEALDVFKDTIAKRKLIELVDLLLHSIDELVIPR